MLTVVVLGFVAMACVIVYFNVVYYRARRAMTPEQRRDEDREAAAQGQIW